MPGIVGDRPTMEEGCAMATMLVIDDNDALRGTLRAILAAGRYEVYAAGNGRAGVACCQDQPIDLVILDLLMPEEEGLTTMRTLWAMTPSPKIIAIAGGGYTGRLRFLETAAMLGADRTLQQPIRAHDLLTTVQELLAEP